MEFVIEWIHSRAMNKDPQRRIAKNTRRVPNRDYSQNNPSLLTWKTYRVTLDNTLYD